MKKITAFLFTSLIFSTVNGQYFWGSDYMPKYPTMNDSIYVYDTISIERTMSENRSVLISKNNDTIRLVYCYQQSGVFWGHEVFGKRTNIGTLNPGKYVVMMNGYVSNNVCTAPFDTFINSLSFPLEVLAYPNAISAIALSGVSISPTVVKEKIEISGLPNERSVIEVYDLQGKMLHSITTKNSTASLQIADLTSGVYVISIRIGSEQRRWKILKE